MRDRFGIFGAVIRIRKLSLLLVMTLRMPNKHLRDCGVPQEFCNGSIPPPQGKEEKELEKTLARVTFMGPLELTFARSLASPAMESRTQ
jgi:hypothetical protein